MENVPRVEAAGRGRAARSVGRLLRRGQGRARAGRRATEQAPNAGRRATEQAPKAEPAHRRAAPEQEALRRGHLAADLAERGRPSPAAPAARRRRRRARHRPRRATGPRCDGAARAAAEVLEGVLEQRGQLLKGPPGPRFVEEEGAPLRVAEEAAVQGEGRGEEPEVGGLPGEIGEEAWGVLSLGGV